MRSFNSRASSYLYRLIRALYEEKGFLFFENGVYNLNIIGVRSQLDNHDQFNDYILLMYKQYLSSGIIIEIMPATTLPGVYYLKNPIDVNGTAILPPGQYLSKFEKGDHKGYEAVTQLLVWRDCDLNDLVDVNENMPLYPAYGIDIHRSSYKYGMVGPTSINYDSGGCQVILYPGHYSHFMGLVDASVRLYGNSLSYTLIMEDDIRRIDAFISGNSGLY